MNTHIKTWLGTLIIIIMAITAGMFVWKVYEMNDISDPMPQTIKIPKPKAKENNLGMANPASVFCEQNGGKLEIVTATDGSQSGICKFSDGSQCEEWAFQRGECKKELIIEKWENYKSDEYGFEFKNPGNFVLDIFSNENSKNFVMKENKDSMWVYSIEVKKNSDNSNFNEILKKEMLARGIGSTKGIDITIDGKKGKRFSIANYGDYGNADILLVSDDNIIEIHGDDSNDLLKKGFENFISTFKFIN